jgi:cobalt-zinc-cadmium resistance protein CzcA
VAVVLCGLIATRMGSEFVPSSMKATLPSRRCASQAPACRSRSQCSSRLKATLKAKFPEIERIFARTGTAEIASDPMPPNISDGYIMLKPVSEWPEPRKSRDELLAAMQEVMGKIPGNNYEFSQPIQLRFNELISGVRSDVAVKIFGDDMDVLNKTAEEVSSMLQKIQGSSEVKVEQTTGLPMLTVNIDRQKAARYGLNVADIQDTVATAIGGREAGTLFEGDRRFDILVRLPESLRNDLEGMKRLPIPLAARRGHRQKGEPTSFRWPR